MSYYDTFLHMHQMDICCCKPTTSRRANISERTDVRRFFSFQKRAHPPGGVPVRGSGRTVCGDGVDIPKARRLPARPPGPNAIVVVYCYIDS